MTKIFTRKASSFYGLLLATVLTITGYVASAAVPTITSVTATSGLPVTGTVTITGTGFNDTTTRNVVWFGNIKGTVTSASATSLVVTVPVGARYSEITLLNLTTRLSAKSQQLFAPDYDASCYISNSQAFKPRLDMDVNHDIMLNTDPYGVAIGDIDGDGKADMVVCMYDTILGTPGRKAVVNIYRNTGAPGTVAYDTAVRIPISNGSFQVKLADLDGDGKLDVIVASSGSGRVGFIRNTSAVGTITFALYTASNTRTFTSGAREVAVADFDGDGRLDIAGAVPNESQVEIFYNRMNSVPSASFPSNAFSTVRVDIPVASGCVGICAGDMDGDGKTDIVTANAGDGSITILRNISDIDTFIFEPGVNFTAGTTTASVRLLDVNNDGRPDVVASNFGSDNLTIFQNNISGTPLSGTSMGTGINFSSGAGSGPSTLDVGDIDGDGKTDIAVALGNGNAVAVFKNAYSGGPIAAGTFSAPTILSTGTTSNTAGVTIGDLDGDTKPDIVSANIGTDNISIFKNTSAPDTVSITGIDSVCVAATRTLTNAHCANEHIYWSLTNANATIVGGLGAADVNAVVTGVTAGVDTVIGTVVSLYDTNYVRYIIRVLPVGDTGTITGATDVCVGAVITLAETVTGGTWISTAPANATVSGGVITGLTPGSTTILYTVSSLSCGSLSAHHTVTVNALPNAGAISGPGGVCSGSSISLTASLPGGSWVNTHPLVASTVTSGTAITLTGLAVGVDTILYVATTPLCGSDTAIKEVGVVSTGVSLSITGPDSVCNGATITLSNGATGGTWSTLGTAIISVNAITGAVTGLSAGTTTVTYTVAYGCGPIVSYKNITVNPLPNAGTISGLDSVCNGATISLTTTGSGGTWSSSATGTATVSATGIVGGASATLATATISYTASTFSCGSATATHAVTVKPMPNAGAIVGLDSVCSGAIISLTNPTAGAGTWSSLSTSIATVSATGVVGGVSATLATTSIVYTAATFSCGSATVNHAVTVKPLPNAGTISGLDSVCNGATISLTTTGTGGTWISSATGTATVSATGVVGGASATLATATISYSASTFSCGSAAATHAVTVKPLPNAGAIVGLDSVCSGAVITLTNPTAGAGTWSSLSSAIATVNASGVVGGVSATLATTSIVYTAGTFSCGSATVNHAVTVKPLPNAGTISGLDSVCRGATISLTTTGTGGTWSSSATGTATISATGVVGGASATLVTATISYTASTFSCGSATATHAVTVKPLPNAGAIVGLDSVCSGAVITLTNPTAGIGTWSSLSSAIATVNTSGGVGGVSATLATTSIVYTAATFSCGSATVNHAVTVKPLPNAGTISGPSSVCYGATISLNATIAGGTWSSASSSIATVSGAGTLGTVGGASTTLASTTISYTSSTFSCGSATATQAVTVNPLPSVSPIVGPSSVCEQSNITLTDAAPGGAWSSTNTAAATIAGGVVGGVAAGNSTISYTVTNSCGAAAATIALTVNQSPVAGIISGTTTTVCETATIVYTDPAPGGVWASGNTGVATVSGGTVGGVAVGNTLISYTVTNGCGTAFDTIDVIVNPLPHAGTISGPTSVCEQSSVSLTVTSTGGTWASGSTPTATVTAGGVVGGGITGPVNITYTVTNFCGTDIANYPMTVNPLPHAGTISGVPNLCPGTTTVLSSTQPGGVWATTPTSIATITAGGVAGGVVPGNATVRYIYTNVCGSDTSTYNITVIAPPVAGTLSGPSLLCPGFTITLSSTTSGGAWTTMTPAVATVVGATGVVGGVAAGVATIRYTVTNFCGAAFTTRSVTVNPIVVPSVTFSITPNDTICAGTAVTFTATAVNGGPSPAFTWTNYGTPIGSGNPFVYAPNNLDNIGLIMTSSAPCPVPPADTTGPVSFLVYPVVTPIVTITSSVPGDVISYLGQLVTFFANPTYGGTTPTFQWFLNGVEVAGATSATYTAYVESPDTVYCVMTSNLECTTSAVDTSNIKIITIGTLSVNDLDGELDGITMFPNPNNGRFTISGNVSGMSNTTVQFYVTDMLGKTVYTDNTTATNGSFKHELRLGSNIPAGNYLVRIVKDNNVRTVRFTLNN